LYICLATTLACKGYHVYIILDCILYNLRLYITFSSGIRGGEWIPYEHNLFYLWTLPFHILGTTFWKLDTLSRAPHKVCRVYFLSAQLISSVKFDASVHQWEDLRGRTARMFAICKIYWYVSSLARYHSDFLFGYRYFRDGLIYNGVVCIPRAMP
jgi:hypothetical protein